MHLLIALPIASSFASRLALAKAPMLKRPFLSLCAWSKILRMGQTAPNFTQQWPTTLKTLLSFHFFEIRPIKPKISLKRRKKRRVNKTYLSLPLKKSRIRFLEWFSNLRKAQAFLVNMAETLQSYFRKALNNIALNLVSHRYVSGVLKEDHFVSARSLTPRF